ncbi:helix-turn-helix domain-containing protein [Nocardioides sp. URHA0020]|uniref:helix-turn-helix domain-containing protein n=1 Tax=Nocardioides sp. URHA0020 TaxID=1380392 RepID=UPI0018CC4D70|nr:helix-turn-helix domain-containing protein [Nocardioides sp. URHA0020]
MTMNSDGRCACCVPRSTEPSATEPVEDEARTGIGSALPGFASPIAAAHTVLLTVEEAAQYLRIGRSKIYELLRDETLASVRIGRRRLVHVVEVNRYADSLATKDRDL